MYVSLYNYLNLLDLNEDHVNRGFLIYVYRFRFLNCLTVLIVIDEDGLTWNIGRKDHGRIIFRVKRFLVFAIFTFGLLNWEEFIFNGFKQHQKLYEEQVERCLSFICLGRNLFASMESIWKGVNEGLDAFWICWNWVLDDQRVFLVWCLILVEVGALDDACLNILSLGTKWF